MCAYIHVSMCVIAHKCHDHKKLGRNGFIVFYTPTSQPLSERNQGGNSKKKLEPANTAWRDLLSILCPASSALLSKLSRTIQTHLPRDGSVTVAGASPINE